MTRLLPGATIVLALALSHSALAQQQQNQLDSNISLFSVLAAINASGYDAEIDSAANHPLRAAIRQHLASRNLGTVGEIKKFFAEHKKADSTAELSQYISFALATTGPPNFNFRFKDHEIPPDVQALAGFAELMTRFHKEAEIDQLYKKVEPAFDQVIEKYHEPVSRAVLEINGYLRNVTSGYLGRRFQIYVDILGAPNQIQTRSYGDDYFIVLTPSPEPMIGDIRHGYLHYLLDPLNFKFAANWEKKKAKALMDYAEGAPALEEGYKSDFLLLATECLIKAVETRLPGGKGPAGIEQALKEGFILTPFFDEQMRVFEKQESSMRYFYPEMIEALSLKKEEQRLEKVEFAQAKAVRKARTVAPKEVKVELTGAAKTLDDGENLYRNKDYPKAKELFLKALEQTVEKPLHAKAYYGLARIAALDRNPELAEKLFQKTLELSPDPQTKSWTHLYLGRLADLANDRDSATTQYKAAVAVEGGSAAARQAAQKGLQESFERQKKE